jgi:tetratricopeptide (TPR) repeat protein
MAFDVTQVLSSRENGNAGGFNPSNEYQEALRAFWNGDFESSLDLISNTIAENPDGEDRYNSYRLWIELLAEVNDTESLQALVKHLMLRGQAEPEFSNHYGALRGLVHFELDEFNAATLLSRACAASGDTPWSLELEQLVTNRVVDQVPVPALGRSSSPIFDYFHISSLAKGLMLAGDDNSVDAVLTHANDIWRGSPLSLQFQMHRAFDEQNFKTVGSIAKSLVELSPDNASYHYYHGYALVKDGAFEAALPVLETASKLFGETDGEILSLIGQCHAATQNFQKAESFLKRSISQLRAEGYPSTKERLALLAVEEEIRGDAVDPVMEMPQSTRMWLVNLSPRRFNELRNGKLSDVENIMRPMGDSPKTGDFCFFASTNNLENGGQQWKIGAIYSVDSEAIWHATDKFQNSLQLVSRPEICIPVDVTLMEENTQTGEIDANHPFSFGVYELEMGALDVITEAVKMKREELEDSTVTLSGKVG